MQNQQINVEYFFRLLYDLFHGTQTDTTVISAFLARVWLWISVIGYGFSIFGFFIIIYATTKLFELRKREEEFYNTLLVTPEAAGANPRWQHLQELVLGATPSEWREAITEADIMLDDTLTKRGYVGDTVSDKLKNADFATINDAWEAHKVRNRIAHDGSAFDLSEALAHRTIQQYERVFRELGAI